MWSREVRHELFETEEGRSLGERAFYEDGLTKNANGDYLLYSKREQDKKNKGNDAANSRMSKRQKKIDKEKEQARHYREALACMGLGFDSEGHACL